MGEVKRLPQAIDSLSEEDAIGVYLRLLDDFGEIVLESGFDTIEVELGFSLIRADHLLPVAADIRRRISQFRAVSCHLPLGEVNISALHPGIRRAAVEETKKHIDLCTQLGIARVVMHPGSFAATPDRYLLLAHQTRRIAEESALEIFRYCRSRDVDLSVENLHRNEPLFRTPEEFEAFARQGIGITLDTVHAFVSGVNPLDFIARFGAAITEVHLSDGVESEPLAHYPIGTGSVDCLAVLRGLEEIDFQGRVIIEVESKEALIESRRFLSANGCI